MNEAWILQYIFFRGMGGSHDVDIMLREVVTKWGCLITKDGGGVKNLGKSAYIKSEHSLTL